MSRLIFTILIVLVTSSPVSSEKQVSLGNKEDLSHMPSSEKLIAEAWKASHKKDLKGINELLTQCLNLYGDDATFQQKTLGHKKPQHKNIKKYSSLNNVATIIFIKAEYLMTLGETKEAIALFKEIIKEYPSAHMLEEKMHEQKLIAEIAQDSINILTGNIQEEEIKDVLKTLPKLYTIGKKQVLNFLDYGHFENVGTSDYKFVFHSIESKKSLFIDIGEMPFPNSGSIYTNPNVKNLLKEDRLKGKHWDFVNSDDLEAAYIKWSTAPEPPGVKLFYIGNIFEKANMYYEAIKAYQTLIINFPKTVAWTYWQTPWYPAQAAIGKIKYIINSHPELNIQVSGMRINVNNGYDNDIKNDDIITYPGQITFKQKDAPEEELQPLGNPTKIIGEGRVQLAQYTNGHWQLLVDKTPFLIKGITYTPTTIGQSPDKGTLKSWMTQDNNNNGKADGPYDSWVDKNRNNIQDTDEITIGDFQLMKDMGVNVIREYHQPFEPNKEILRTLFQDYGIRIIMGDFLGKYAIGSGAEWSPGTDYDNEEHKKNMMASVRKMVLDHKDEDYLLMWILGNENNYGVASNADKKPRAFFKFLNEVALMIKSIDKNHPVAFVNGDTLFLDIFAQYAPNVDIVGANVYRGNYGFGSFWDQVRDVTKNSKPAMITEYGSPAFIRYRTQDLAETLQAKYHKGNWLDIESNSAGHIAGIGNSIGGITFSYMDEWWKSHNPYLHDKKSSTVGPFPGGFYYEEWFGLISQGNGNNSPFMRQLRKSYYLYKNLWN